MAAYEDLRYLQLRLAAGQRREIEELSKRLGVSYSDIVRGSLSLGLPIFSALMEVKAELARRFVSALKKEARLGQL